VRYLRHQNCGRFRSLVHDRFCSLASLFLKARADHLLRYWHWNLLSRHVATSDDMKGTVQNRQLHSEDIEHAATHGT